MGKQIVPLRPRQKEGTPKVPKRLTLADVTVVRRWKDGDELGRISGPALAKLIEATKPEKGRPGLVDAGTIWEELDCLADTLHLLGAAEKEGELPLDKSLYWIGECLKRLGSRVMALDHGGKGSNSAPDCYFVEVTK